MIYGLYAKATEGSCALEPTDLFLLDGNPRRKAIEDL